MSIELINFGAASAGHYPDELKKRVEDFTARSSAWRGTVADLARRRETALFIPATARMENWNNERPSWIGVDTFTDGDAVLNYVQNARRLALSLPVEGLALVRELASIRDAATQAWTEHHDKLTAALATAKAAAEKEANAFKGLSQSAREAHVQERTADVTTACCVQNPTPEKLNCWNVLTLKTAAEQLLGELQRAVAAALR
jgi:hypothetical protein